MTMQKEKKTKIIAEYHRDRKDTGSADVQVAILTGRINELSEHFKGHPKDHHSRYGLIQMVNRRRKLLQYLQKTDSNRYKDLITRLNIRK
ncbi:30S ribosomal protein S15 [Omnitrophica bacterium]|nr:30S ribosomal protein S15 [Candidatus Omnitrophota bacterium]